MIQYIKNLFVKKDNKPVQKSEVIIPKPIINEAYDSVPVIKEVYDDFGQIHLDHNADKNYAYYLNELQKGATQYRIIEDHKKNFTYDLDDMEDSYCYLTIEIFYKETNKIVKRYSVMGYCRHANMMWHKIPVKATKEEINDFIMYFSKCI